MTEPPYSHVGKQVLYHGKHYADARDNETAAHIVEALTEWEARKDDRK